MRLTQDQRHAIVNEAAAIIDCPKEREAEESAHAELATNLRFWLADILSTEDAAVLARHGCLASVSQLTCNDTSNKQSATFCFCPRDYRDSVRRGCHRQNHSATAQHLAERAAASVSVPSSWHNAYASNTNIPAINREQWWPLFAAFNNAQLAHDRARSTILDKLRRGLEGCKTMAQAIALWPHAAALLPRAAVPPTETESERIAAELATVKVRSP